MASNLVQLNDLSTRYDTSASLRRQIQSDMILYIYATTDLIQPSDVLYSKSTHISMEFMFNFMFMSTFVCIYVIVMQFTTTHVHSSSLMGHPFNTQADIPFDYLREGSCARLVDRGARMAEVWNTISFNGAIANSTIVIKCLVSSFCEVCHLVQGNTTEESLFPTIPTMV